MYFQKISLIPKISDIYKRQTLCQTVGGLNCDVLTITSKDSQVK